MSVWLTLTDRDRGHVTINLDSVTCFYGIRDGTTIWLTSGPVLHVTEGYMAVHERLEKALNV